MDKLKYWLKWLTNTTIKTEHRTEIVPYYFSVNAQNYRDVIDFLKSQLASAENARKEAEKAARKNLYPDEDMLNAIKASRILKRFKMELDQWTAN